MAALHLAGHGHQVLLLDKYGFPREKVCGDALIPDAIASLQRAGLYEEVRQHSFHSTTVSIYSPSQVRIDLPGSFLTLRREILDAVVLRAAKTRGATFRHAQVMALAEQNGHVTARLRDGSVVRGRYAVIATGADVALLTQVGLVTRGRASGIAARYYVQSDMSIEELVVSLDRAILPGYAWIFPMTGGQFNVGCGVFYHGRKHRGANLRSALEVWVRQFPIARELMRHATHVTTLRGARLRCGLKGAVAHRGGRILAIGETLGTTFPFTGEGIGKAMETGELAARHIHQAIEDADIAPVQALPLAIERELAPKYVGYDIAEAWVSRPWLADRLAKRIQRNPRLRQAAAGILSETVDPRMLFRWRNLLPRWLR